MALTLSSEPPDVVCARLVAAQLAACAGLVEFFGTHISSIEHDQVGLPAPVPALMVIPVRQEPKRRPTGIYDSLITLEIRAILPRPTPASAFLATPAAPSVSTPGAGIAYRITQFGAAGESWASEPTSSTGIATVTLPALASGATAFRIWRSAASSSWCRWVGTSYASGTWADATTNAMGYEAAPIRGLGSRLLAMISERLIRHDDDNEYLPSGGSYMAAGGLTLKPLRSRFDAQRNLVAHVLEATYQTTYDPETQLIS